MFKPYPYKEKRKHPRFPLNLPLEYQEVGLPGAYGGIVVNGSSFGLLIQSLKDMPIGARLSFMVLFVNGFQLGSFEGVAEIVRKDRVKMKMDTRYEYGLKTVHMKEEDHLKLRQFLTDQHQVETEFVPNGFEVKQEWGSIA